jgi:site-specific recombinase XerD
VWLSDAIVQSDTASLPLLVNSGGSAACFAWEEFIFGKIRNWHTRAAYERAIRQFLRHCETLGRELHTVSPRDVGSNMDSLDYATATKKLHLSALRHFFDSLATRHVVVLNTAASVRGERLQVVEGKTPEISIEQARRLMGSIDTPTVVGLRDRAIIGTLIYTAAQVGAIAKLCRRDFYDVGAQHCLRFAEKGGKSPEIPVRHDLQQYIRVYLATSCLDYAEKTSPLFRTTIRRTNRLTINRMTASDIGRMVNRCVCKAGLPTQLSPHSFRVYVANEVMWRWFSFRWIGLPFRVILHHITKLTEFPLMEARQT